MLVTSLYSGENELFVEQCQCPPGYMGGSCERCSFGFARVYEETMAHERVGKCVQCDCNGHAGCDVSGAEKCDECQHNTYGDRCQRCSVGFYGNALNGQPDDCRRCECPLLEDSNNFSPSCQLKELSLGTNHMTNELSPSNFSIDFVCTQCPTGYTGDQCEKYVSGNG